MTCHARLAPAPANRQFPGRMISPLISLALRGAIRFYQLTLAYFFVGACRYEPSCSAYAAEAVAPHGALLGGWLAAHRLRPCGPCGGQGHGPRPPLSRPPAATLSPPARDIRF